MVSITPEVKLRVLEKDDWIYVGKGYYPNDRKGLPSMNTIRLHNYTLHNRGESYRISEKTDRPIIELLFEEHAKRKKNEVEIEIRGLEKEAAIYNLK